MLSSSPPPDLALRCSLGEGAARGSSSKMDEARRQGKGKALGPCLPTASWLSISERCNLDSIMMPRPLKAEGCGHELSGHRELKSVPENVVAGLGFGLNRSAPLLRTLSPNGQTQRPPTSHVPGLSS